MSRGVSEKLRVFSETPTRLWTRFQPLPEGVAPFTTGLIEDPRFLEPAEQALGSAIGLGTDANRYVGGTGWHNDHSNDGAPHIDALKWIFYLDPVGPDSGALRVIPGSHLLDVKHPDFPATT